MNINISEYIQRNLQKDFKWRKIIFYFCLYGNYTFFYLELQHMLYESDIYIVPKILTVIIMGSAFGIIANFSICYFIKLTNRFFNANSTFKDICKTFTLAFKPHLVTVPIIFFLLIITPANGTTYLHENYFIYLYVTILLKGISGVMAILSVILLFRGLMLTQNLPLDKTILNFLIACLMFSPLCLLWIYR